MSASSGQAARGALQDGVHLNIGLLAGCQAMQLRGGWHRTPWALVDQVALDDGRAVTVRPVLPQDENAEQAFVKALSLESRHRRFHSGVSALSGAVLRSLTDIDYQTHVAMVAETCDELPQRTIVADARYVVGDGGRTADFAIVVADTWQRVGLGKQLMRRLAGHARQNGVQFLTGDVLVSNAPMIALVSSLGGYLTQHPDDTFLLRAHYRIEPPRYQ
jgi:acetyltransferase